MPSTKLAKPANSKSKSKSDPLSDEKQALLDQAIEKRERLADSRLEMAKMFLQKDKPEIALKRLKEIVDEFDGSAAAIEARKMLDGM